MKVKLTYMMLLLTIVAFAYATDTREYKIDTNHSNVGFSVPILGGLSKVRGKFSDFSVVLKNDEKDITKSSVKAVIKTASTNTGITGRDDHLRTADFFDAEKFPEIVFESTQIKKRRAGFVAVGNLSMHGVTKQIELPFSITGTRKSPKDNLMNVGYLARLTLNRRDFGINWTHPSSPDFVGDLIDIEINLITRAIDIK